MEGEQMAHTDISDINVDDLEKVGSLPLILNLKPEGVRALNYIKDNKFSVQRLLVENGAVLVRGLKIHGSKEFGKVLNEIFGSELLQYTYRSTPRTEFRGNVYTATEYPASEVIPQHNENAFSRSWPDRLGLLCLIPSETGGETPISCSQDIYEKIPKAIRQEFEEKQLMYVRNYLDIDLPWTEVFQTDDKSEVEAYCQENGLDFEWLENGLRTKQVNPATAMHKTTGKPLWFNQAHLFHVSNLDKDLAKTLINSLGEENLPRNTFFGDGSKIPEAYLTTIREAYEQSKIKFKWQKHDLLLLDNMRFTHGREPYTGDRKVIVGMACPNGVTP